MKNKMSFFNGRAFYSTIGISLLISMTGTSFWASWMIGTILGIIILLIIKKNNNYKFIKSMTGFILSALSIMLIVNIGHTLYLRETPIIYLSIPPIIATLILSNSKKEPLKKILSLFFICSITLFFIKIFLLFPHININNLRPQYISDINSVLGGSIVYALIGITPIISLNNISDKKSIIVNYVISSLTVLCISFLAVTVLGVKEATIYRNPEYIILKKINFLDFINNTDGFFNFAVILDLLFTASAGFRNIEFKNKTTKYFCPILLSIIVILACYKNWPILWLYYNLPYVFIFLLFLSLIPKKSKYKNAKS